MGRFNCVIPNKIFVNIIVKYPLFIHGGKKIKAHILWLKNWVLQLQEQFKISNGAP